MFFFEPLGNYHLAKKSGNFPENLFLWVVRLRACSHYTEKFGLVFAKKLKIL